MTLTELSFNVPDIGVSINLNLYGIGTHDYDIKSLIKNNFNYSMKSGYTYEPIYRNLTVRNIFDNSEQFNPVTKLFVTGDTRFANIKAYATVPLNEIGIQLLQETMRRDAIEPGEEIYHFIATALVIADDLETSRDEAKQLIDIANEMLKGPYVRDFMMLTPERAEVLEELALFEEELKQIEIDQEVEKQLEIATKKSKKQRTIVLSR